MTSGSATLEEINTRADTPRSIHPEKIIGNFREIEQTRLRLVMNLVHLSVFSYSSWDEMGSYDVPAIINYILTVTRRTKVIYIGHSMGCAVFFVAMVTHPELNDKIELMMALAPATSLAHMTSPIRYFAPFVGPLQVCLI